jgi:hypothetical protein
MDVPAFAVQHLGRSDQGRRSRGRSAAIVGRRVEEMPSELTLEPGGLGAAGYGIYEWGR